MYFLLMVTGFATAQDSSCWKLILNHKLLVSGRPPKQKQVSLSVKEKGYIKLSFNCDKNAEEMNRFFLIMDKNRKELFRKNYDKKKDFVLISMDKLKKITSNQPVDNYTVAIPKDSLMASTIRVKPTLLTSIFWQP